MAISQRRLTLEEFLELPEEKPALEFIGGQVRPKASPKGPHGTLQLEFGHFIRSFAGPRRLGRAFTETRATYGGRSCVPDLIFYCRERVPRTPDGEVADDFTTPPDLAVEIISPGQGTNVLLGRCRWYVDNGVRIALLIDPPRKRILLLRPGAEPVFLTGDDLIDLEDILPGFRLTARQLFDALVVH